jgi:hypothetical protein
VTLVICFAWYVQASGLFYLRHSIITPAITPRGADWAVVRFALLGHQKCIAEFASGPNVGRIHTGHREYSHSTPDRATVYRAPFLVSILRPGHEFFCQIVYVDEALLIGVSPL